MASLVKKIDHVFVTLAGAECAHRFMIDEVGLPEAWPFAPYGFFASGGITVGNANIEFVEATDAFEVITASTPARVQGIAFEPEHIDDAWLAACDRQGLLFLDPMPVEGTGRGGDVELLWTNVIFTDFIASDSMVFVCEYHVPEGLAPEERRRRLDAAGGGVLGVTGLAEVVVGTADLDAAAARWRRLAGEQGGGPFTWPPGMTPAVRLVEAPAERVERLVLAVASPDQAAKAWAGLDTSPLNGLDIDFVAEP